MNRLIIQSLVYACVSLLLVACGGGNSGRTQMSSQGPGQVTIIAPKDGATVPANQPVTVEYEATLGPRGDHLHFIVDGGQPDIVRQLKGKHVIGPLAPGDHTVTIKEETSSHTPTGPQASIKITAK